MIVSPIAPARALRRSRPSVKPALALVLLAGLMLTGCNGKQAAAEPAGTATAVAAAEDAVSVPSVMSLTLDKATDQLKDLGLKVEAVDTVDGKSILVKKNWQVTSQDPTEGTPVDKGSTVKLGVKHLTDPTPTPTPTPAAVVPAEVVAPVVPVAPPAPVAPAPVAPAAPAAPPAPVAPPAPAAVQYANCTAARQAGAAPIYAGTPGYGKHLDRDGDGIGCDK